MAVLESKVNSILESLTLREKIGQTCQERLSRIVIAEEDAEGYLKMNPLGSVFVGGEIIDGPSGSSGEILSLFKRLSKLPLLIAGDLESGAGSAVSGYTTFPSQLALGAANDLSLAYRYGKNTALEGRAAGYNWSFSPVVDLLKNWQNPIVANRALGDSPQRVSELASMIIAGLQDHGMVACAKHFPGDGVDFRDQHLVTSVNSLPEDIWMETFGYAFQQVIQNGVDTIMSGHIALPWRDPLLPNQRRPRPATCSRAILTTLLRGQLGFEGVVVSDALNMAGFTGWADRKTRLIDAFNAGCDVLLWPGQGYIEMMERAIEEESVSIERLNESVRRILKLKDKYGMLDQNDEILEPENTPVNIQSEALRVSREIAVKSITLVRNRDNQLPLAPESTHSILLQFAHPEPLSESHRRHLDVFKDALTRRGIELTVITNGNCEQVQKMQSSGMGWDAYIVVYSLMNHQLKNTVRPTGAMAEVMWTQQNTDSLSAITVSLNSPYMLMDLPYLDTLINAYGCNAEIMEALDKALFGEIPFSDYSPVDLETSI